MGVTPSHGVKGDLHPTLCSLTCGVHLADPRRLVVCTPRGPDVSVIKGSEDQSWVLRPWAHPIGGGMSKGGWGSWIKRRLQTKAMGRGQIDGGQV